MTTRLFAGALALAALATAQPGYAQGRARGHVIPERFQDMDTNHDGIVQRSEWTGTSASFRVYDKNRDGVLSGTELRIGRGRGNQANDRPDVEPPDQGYDYDYDDDAREAHFISLDVNQDGRVARSEWQDTAALFTTLDRNRDGFLSRAEMPAAKAANTTAANHTAAYRAGYDRGLAEGRAAGHEDRVINNYWDLEGQRELETADSGYQASVGSKDQYQAGYRDGFRRAYREEWNKAAGQ